MNRAPPRRVGGEFYRWIFVMFKRCDYIDT